MIFLLFGRDGLQCGLRFRRTEQPHTANSTSAMETRDHSNGVSPKNQRSRGKLLICVLLALAFWGFGNKAMGQFAGGTGTETDPYQISTPDHLVQLFYYLGNDNVHYRVCNCQRKYQ